jgi:tetratricopeptide (TPR) repeat protein
MKTMLICSLLDISNVEITDTILERCGVLEGAYHLVDATLSQNYEGSWRTKHTRWDEELFSFLFNKDSRILLEQRKQVLKDSLIAIYSIQEEDITYSAVGTLYHIAAQNFVPIDIIESVFQQSISQMPTYLSNEKKSSLYTFHIAHAYHKLKKYQEAIHKSNEALKLNSRNAMAYNIKGLALTGLERYDYAIESFDKALEIDPNIATAWMHKGIALDRSRSYKEAMICYDKALEIDPNPKNACLVWINQGICFHHLGEYKEAIKCYEGALDIILYERSLHVNTSEDEDFILYLNSIEANTWRARGDSLFKYGKWDDAIDSYDESLKLNAANPDVWLWKGICHHRLGMYKEAVECYDKALKIDPNHADASYFKGLTLNAEARHKNL